VRWDPNQRCKRCRFGNYFGVMQIPMPRRTRPQRGGREGQPRVAIVNETLVRQLLRGQRPVGIRIDWAGNEPHEWLTIVGLRRT
jgi:hypothetical protein